MYYSLDKAIERAKADDNRRKEIVFNTIRLRGRGDKDITIEKIKRGNK